MFGRGKDGLAVKCPWCKKEVDFHNNGEWKCQHCGATKAPSNQQGLYGVLSNEEGGSPVEVVVI